jgi:xylan 1,4-beta-xylosidase
MLGGPAVIAPGGPFLTQFLEHCATGTNAVTGEIGTRLDFVSFHAKGGVTADGDRVEMDLGNQLRLHRDGFEAVTAFPQFSQTPIYITEADPDGCAACPANLIAGGAYRSSTAYGAYEVEMMKRSIELADELGVELAGVLTWAFTFPETPYFAGYRELASHGIHLPVLSAFELLGRLAGARLPLTSSGAHKLDELIENGVRAAPDVDGMAALEPGTIRVLVWSYHDDLVAAAATRVHVVVKLPATFGRSVRVSHQRVDESHGDAPSLWVAQGMPEPPSAEELVALQQAVASTSLLPDQTVRVDDGSLELDFELPRFGVSLLSLTPAEPGDEQPR